MKKGHVMKIMVMSPPPKNWVVLVTIMNEDKKSFVQYRTNELTEKEAKQAEKILRKTYDTK